MLTIPYAQYFQADLTTLRLEIVGSPEFHRLHWEALKDPGLSQPLVLRATLVRKNLRPLPFHAAVQASPTLNLLIVIARPQGAQDVGYRTISRPLVEALQQAQTPVRVDILRPGTFQALIQHLEETTERQGNGYYHLIHFDVHGGLLQYGDWQAGVQANRYAYQTRYGREEITPYEGLKAFLSLEGEQPDQADLVEASELAERLRRYKKRGKNLSSNFLIFKDMKMQESCTRSARNRYFQGKNIVSFCS